ncbi:hypothetical protein HZS_4813, partial [Henneguya salminicola]
MPNQSLINVVSAIYTLLLGEEKSIDIAQFLWEISKNALKKVNNPKKILKEEFQAYLLKKIALQPEPSINDSPQEVNGINKITHSIPSSLKRKTSNVEYNMQKKVGKKNTLVDMFANWHLTPAYEKRSNDSDLYSSSEESQLEQSINLKSESSSFYSSFEDTDVSPLNFSACLSNG